MSGAIRPAISRITSEIAEGVAPHVIWNTTSRTEWRATDKSEFRDQKPELRTAAWPQAFSEARV